MPKSFFDCCRGPSNELDHYHDDKHYYDKHNDHHHCHNPRYHRHYRHDNARCHRYDNYDHGAAEGVRS